SGAHSILQRRWDCCRQPRPSGVCSPVVHVSFSMEFIMNRRIRMLPVLVAVVLLSGSVTSGASAQLDDEIKAALNDAFDKGDALAKAGKYAEAVLHFERLVALAAKAVGPNHIALTGPLNNLGMSLMIVGRFKDAEPHLRRCLEL